MQSKSIYNNRPVNFNPLDCKQFVFPVNQSEYKKNLIYLQQSCNTQAAWTHGDLVFTERVDFIFTPHRFKRNRLITDHNMFFLQIVVPF